MDQTLGNDVFIKYLYHNKVCFAQQTFIFLSPCVSLDSARGTPEPGLDVSRPHIRLPSGPPLQLARLPPPLHEPPQRGREVGGCEDQEEAQTDEEDPGQFHPVVSEGHEVLLDVVEGRGGNGGNQAEGDEVLVGDDHAEVGEHVGN